ncbi:hypothetical protein [Alkalilimnicola sp. S0819]|uniref:hypothetical protein n=1 Tax=Alkalilimnicola sp. S0819 TaxID=2613922 RepID=UPI0012619ACD|nr:hypothetical protein [Alkalilimnicola sp. S0819]KAB7622783.1 hypothetical protein F3N43_11610 [Alkalilimnicola sp. S0819]MPQ17279.1 hypothetical protein [Alkalilimnicola sp. S0819]
MSDDHQAVYDAAAQQTVELGNQMADADEQADLWDIADGILAGAVQYWLYTRQPCDDPACEDCASIRTGELRLADLRKLVDDFARNSEYFHSPNDFGAGRA